MTDPNAIKTPALALYQPDIPQNVGAAIRLCACLDLGLHVIEPCGFPWDEKKIRQSGMDYVEQLSVMRHGSWDKFNASRGPRRLILMTTKAAMNYTEFKFEPDDILLAGRESAGVPDYVHDAADGRIVIPMKAGLRSLNVINASAMILGEVIRQTRA